MTITKKVMRMSELNSYLILPKKQMNFLSMREEEFICKIDAELVGESLLTQIFENYR